MKTFGILSSSRRRKSEVDVTIKIVGLSGPSFGTTSELPTAAEFFFLVKVSNGMVPSEKNKLEC